MQFSSSLPQPRIYSVPSASAFHPIASRQTPIYLRGSHLHCISAIQISSKPVNIVVPAGAPTWPFAYEAKVMEKASKLAVASRVSAALAGARGTGFHGRPVGGDGERSASKPGTN
jgi:hypothetical protein